MPPLPRSFDINGLLIEGNLIATMAHGQSHHPLVYQAVRQYTLQTLHHIILGYGRKEQVIFIVLKVFKGSVLGNMGYTHTDRSSRSAASGIFKVCIPIRRC
jgi:hypothetical protein